MVRTFYPQTGSFSIITNDENNPQNSALNPPDGDIPPPTFENETFDNSTQGTGDITFDNSIQGTGIITVAVETP